eukprot:scaffold624_cov402-Prasinococcus_capsulatus_cf.AAC.2
MPEREGGVWEGGGWCGLEAILAVSNAGPKPLLRNRTCTAHVSKARLHAAGLFQHRRKLHRKDERLRAAPADQRLSFAPWSGTASCARAVNSKGDRPASGVRDTGGPAAPSSAPAPAPLVRYLYGRVPSRRRPARCAAPSPGRRIASAAPRALRRWAVDGWPLAAAELGGGAALQRVALGGGSDLPAASAPYGPTKGAREWSQGSRRGWAKTPTDSLPPSLPPSLRDTGARPFRG